ncbi:Smr/MutS family protein [Oceanicella actignis]|uniref:DNA-nicking endonuclease, Smr domain n=1 Tax=Oceanicella actignis TaxID=1189325 RepID=A0A1M7T1Z5_9RHOB|nr:Smr/MutS family protein [Oceanicella actignis]SET38484.1 DNA-nicking endonuclease, Smr domain [Oceanicella actignis]SHN64726.1 DNA-nicking endonuclease, Smr domain [Oceanicella actignis]
MARRRRPRRLTPEESALWSQVAATADPMRPTPPPAPSEAPPSALRGAPAQPAIEAPPRKSPRRPGAAPPPPPPSPPAPSVAFDFAPEPYDSLAPAEGLDRRTARRLRAGRREPEARLDLHGMTAERAHAALTGFVRASRMRGLRCVLIITGKGGRARCAGEDAPFMAPAEGVLRRAAPRWLRAGPLAGMVVGIYPAHRRHGGEGAFYVYLKKLR